MEVKSETQAKYEEEPMDIGDELYDGNEDGEILSSDEETGEKAVHSLKNSFPNNQPSGFVTGVDVFDEEESQKKLDRAKRFAISADELTSNNVNNGDLSNLYRSLGIDKENERHYRFNAVHMRGTKDMSTDDVFEYFMSYGPSDIEWINDISCNVVWLDDISAARALLCLSKEIKNLDKVHLNADPFEKDLKNKESDSEIDDSDVVDARQINAAIPPGFWRIGVKSAKSDTILLRYATRSDKKPKNAEKLSEYYKKYGNPHFGNTPGILSKSKRDELFQKRKKIDSIIDVDASAENDKKNPWGDLAESWEADEEKGEKRSQIRSRVTLKRSHPYQGPDLRQSLNSKSKVTKAIKPLKKEESEDSNSDLDEHWEVKRKVPRMKMYADDEEKKKEKNIAKAKAVLDLRSKINKAKAYKQTPLPVKVEDLWSCTNSDEDKDSGDWALEQYNDLRESLEQNKKQREASRIKKYDVESDEDQDDDDDFFRDIGRRSPLQIEIDNDEYYRSKAQSDSD